MPAGRRHIDLTGQVFSRLTVLRRVSFSSVGQHALWECQCVCGKTSTVAIDRLRNGTTRSCGCLVRDKASASHRTHGLSRTSEYRIWKGMRSRCYKPTSLDYPQYGGRGIRVSDEWLNDAAAFVRDMGPRPSKKHTIDRIDVNGHYETNNCRWLHVSRQNHNKTTSQFITMNGATVTIAEAARTLGIKPQTLWFRIRKKGMPIERALTPHRLKRQTVTP